MKCFQDLQDELNEMYEEYHRNPIPTYTKEYHIFHKRYKVLQSKIRNYYSISNRIKRAGAKVMRTDIGYRFIGTSGLEVEFFKDACETTFWTLIFEAGTDQQEMDIAWLDDPRTKNDVLIHLFELDQK